MRSEWTSSGGDSPPEPTPIDPKPSGPINPDGVPVPGPSQPVPVDPSPM